MSVGSSTTRHWVNSVSDIYGPDEIEELLEDLQVSSSRRCHVSCEVFSATHAYISMLFYCNFQRLEQAAFETEDIQDFDIDGSQVGHHHHHHQGQAGGRGVGEGHHHQNPYRENHFYYRQRGGIRRDGPMHNDAVDHKWATAVPPTHACSVPPTGCIPVASVSPTFSVSSWDSHANYQNRGVHSTRAPQLLVC